MINARVAALMNIPDGKDLKYGQIKAALILLKIN